MSSPWRICSSAQIRDSDFSTRQAATPGLSGWMTPERRILASTSARSIRNRRSCMQCGSLCEVIVAPLHISYFTYAPHTTIYDRDSTFSFFLLFYSKSQAFFQLLRKIIEYLHRENNAQRHETRIYIQDICIIYLK